MNDDISAATKHWLAQVDRVDSLVGEVSQRSSTAMESFLGHEDSDDWLMVDKVLLIATTARNSLRKAFSQAAIPRKRRLLALALIELGDVSVAESVIDAIVDEPDFFMAAASKMARQGMQSAAPAILHRLRSSLDAAPIVLATLLRALQKLQIPLPQDIGDALRRNPSPEVAEALSGFECSRT